MNIFKRLHLGLTDPVFYKTYMKEGLWKAFFLVLLVTMIASIPGTLVTAFRTQQVMQSVAQEFRTGFESLTFENNELSSKNGDSIFVDMNIGGYTTALAIDTSDAYSIGDLSSYDSGIIFDKTYILRYQKDMNPDKIYYSNIMGIFGNMSFSLTGNEIADMFTISPIALISGILISIVLGSIFFVTFTALLVSVAASINSSMLKLNLSYGNNLKIALYSMLLPVIIYQLALVIPYVPSLLVLFLFYFISGRYISRTYRSLYTDTLQKALHDYTKEKAEKEKKDHQNDDPSK